MIRPPQPTVSRPGVAAIELALVLPLILVLLFGIWDVGRMIEVQQLVNNAAREGARQAAIGSMLDPITGSQKDITAAVVQQTVLNYLIRNKINTSGAAIQFLNLDRPGATDPFQAQHLDHLRVMVQLPFDNVRFVLVNNFLDVNGKTLTASSDWLSLRDVNLTVSTTLPTN